MDCECNKDFVTTAAVIEAGDAMPILREITLEALQPDELLVHLSACGVCATDLKVLADPTLRPIVLGHEGAGVVEAVGSNVEGIVKGDHVLLSFESCGSCAQCRDGHPAYCEDFRGLNFSGCRADGTSGAHNSKGKILGRFFGQSSFAMHAVATQRNAIVVPKHIDLSLLAPLGCGIQTGAGAILNVLRPQHGSVLVLGAGAVGLSAVLACVYLEIPAIVVDPEASRRELAIKLGAAAAIASDAENVLDAVVAASAEPFNYALVTAPVTKAFELAVDALSKRGNLAYVAAPSRDPWTPDWLKIMTKGLSITGVIEGDAAPKQFLPWLISLWQSGRFPFEQLLSFYSFKSIKEALSDAASGKVVKAVLLFDES